MSNMNISVASGIGGSGQLCYCNSLEVGVILLRNRELREEIHLEGCPGQLNAWQGTQKAYGFSQQVFVLACILYIISFTF